MAYATTADVQDRLGRPLTADETTLTAVLLDDAEALIRARIKDLDTRAADADYLRLLVMVEANAVLRVLRNPEGYRSETDGDYSYARMVAVASGLLEILESDWRLLGIRDGAFTIAPKVRTPRFGPLLRRRHDCDRGPW